MKLCEKTENQEFVERILVPVLKAGADILCVGKTLRQRAFLHCMHTCIGAHTHKCVSTYLPTYQSSTHGSLSLSLLSIVANICKYINYTKAISQIDMYSQSAVRIRIRRSQSTIPQILNLNCQQFWGDKLRVPPILIAFFIQYWMQCQAPNPKN